MKIKRVKLIGFKRFTDLEIVGIPESAKLIVLVGPNGSGKTSLFEAFNHWYKLTGYGNSGGEEYAVKKGAPAIGGNWFQERVKIDFFGGQQKTGNGVRGSFYFRTAYRNEADFTISNLGKQPNPTAHFRFPDLIQNDKVVSENYQRLVSKTLEDVYLPENGEKTVASLREELIGSVNKSLSAVFDDLRLSSIGNPVLNGSFYFSKGAAKDFHYKNLSAGEKSAFDLILDLLVKSIYYPESIYCIDEPESHMHTRLQSRLLGELYRLIPEESQLWISTHSIGMLREAEAIEKSHPNTVVFLNLDNRDFDLPEIITPSSIDKNIWDRFFELALGEFAGLVAPNVIVFCEGSSQGRKYKDFDAQIFQKIFGQKYYETKFVSGGSSSEIGDLENQSFRVISSVLKNSKVIKYIDRDGRSAQEILELRESGIRVSRRRNIECYLFDDEVIKKLCVEVGRIQLFDACIEIKKKALEESVSRGNATDDVKSASGHIFTGIVKILEIERGGNNKCSFMRDTMAPLITSDTLVYREIEHDMFQE